MVVRSDSKHREEAAVGAHYVPPYLPETGQVAAEAEASYVLRYLQDFALVAEVEVGATEKRLSRPEAVVEVQRLFARNLSQGLSSQVPQVCRHWIPTLKGMHVPAQPDASL